MSQNSLAHFKNVAAFAVRCVRFVKCVWTFWDILYYRIKAAQAYLVPCQTTRREDFAKNNYYFLAVSYFVKCSRQGPKNASSMVNEVIKVILKPLFFFFFTRRFHTHKKRKKHKKHKTSNKQFFFLLDVFYEHKKHKKH